MPSAGYILTILPSTSASSMPEVFERSGGEYATDVGNVMSCVDGSSEMGTWSAPVGASAGELCFLRIASTAPRRMAALASISRALIAEPGLVTCVRREAEFAKQFAGHIVGVARLGSDSVVAGGPNTAFAWLGSVAKVADGGVKVSTFGPGLRRVSTFGGITRLDGDEVSELLSRCGLLPADVM